VKRYFADRDKAERCRQQIEFSEKSETEIDTYAKTRLTSGQVADAEMAYKLLERTPVGSLSEAVDWLAKNYVEPSTSKTVQETCEEWLAGKAKENLAERSMKELRQTAKQLQQAFGPLKLHQVTAASVDGLIPKTASAQTRKNYITKYSQVFNWAAKLGYVSSNPLDAINKPKVAGSDNVALTLAQTKAVLRAAYGTCIQSLVALQLFAGLRNLEAQRLGWDQVESFEKIGFGSLSSDLSELDFAAIKLGDVNGDWTDPNATTLSGRDAMESAGLMRLSAPQATSDGSVSMDLHADGMEGLLGLQFGLNWDG